MGRQGAHYAVRPPSPPRLKGEEGLSLNFGKRLSHTDKVVRDRGFRVLKKWLKGNPELERLDFMKLWKGLYFAMWMSDKRPIQQELCVNIALLMEDVPIKKQNLWIDCFWEIMLMHWDNLDKHRLNKYLLFVRIVVAETFKSLRCRGWSIEDCTTIGQSFARGATYGPGLALVIHFSRVFWDEMEPQLEAQPEVPAAALFAILVPFLDLAATFGTDTLVKDIHDYILRRCPSSVCQAVVEKMLTDASKESTPKRSRELLYETADVLEKKSGLVIEKMDFKHLKPKKMLVVNGAMRTKKRRRGKKNKKAATAEDGGVDAIKEVNEAESMAAHDEEDDEQQESYRGMSPLMLSKAAMPLPKESRKPKQKKRKLEEIASNGATSPREAKPPSPAAQAAVLEQGEGTALKSKKKRRKTGTASPGLTSASPKSTDAKASPRNVSFDLRSTEVVQFNRRDLVTKVSKGSPSPKDSGHSKSALRGC